LRLTPAANRSGLSLLLWWPLHSAGPLFPQVQNHPRSSSSTPGSPRLPEPPSFPPEAVCALGPGLAIQSGQVLLTEHELPVAEALSGQTAK
ncbi:hypothetical protein INR49_009510, partial [Caranx melampygus]